MRPGELALEREVPNVYDELCRVWSDVTARLTFVNSVVPASCSKQALPSWRRYDEAVLIPRTHAMEVGSVFELDGQIVYFRNLEKEKGKRV